MSAHDAPAEAGGSVAVGPVVKAAEGGGAEAEAAPKEAEAGTHIVHEATCTHKANFETFSQGLGKLYIGMKINVWIFHVCIINPM